jgi:hypothetical protein
MNKKIYKNPLLWLYSLALIICVYNFVILFTIWGPPCIISKVADNDNDVTISELWTAFTFYVEKAAVKFNKNEQLIYQWFIIRSFIAIIYITTAFFVIRRKYWSRLLLLFLITINALLGIIYIYLMDKNVTVANYLGNEIDIIINEIDIIIYYCIIVIFFTRKSVVLLFTEPSQAPHNSIEK